jgi:hypothetical protein
MADWLITLAIHPKHVNLTAINKPEKIIIILLKDSKIFAVSYKKEE